MVGPAALQVSWVRQAWILVQVFVVEAFNPVWNGSKGKPDQYSASVEPSDEPLLTCSGQRKWPGCLSNRSYVGIKV